MSEKIINMSNDDEEDIDINPIQTITKFSENSNSNDNSKD